MAESSVYIYNNMIICIYIFQRVMIKFMFVRNIVYTHIFNKYSRSM